MGRNFPCSARLSSLGSSSTCPPEMIADTPFTRTCLTLGAVISSSLSMARHSLLGCIWFNICLQRTILIHTGSLEKESRRRLTTSRWTSTLR